MGRTKTITDDELLKIARAVFREHGHTAATRDVARAAGVSQAVLFQRFGSKDDLFLLAMTPELPDLDVLLGPYRPRSVKADLVRIAERLREFFASHMPTLLHVLAHPDLRASRLRKWHGLLPFGPILHALAHRLQRLQADGLIRKTSPEAAAHAIVHAVHTMAFLENMLGEHGHGPAATVEGLIDVIWTGLAPR